MEFLIINIKISSDKEEIVKWKFGDLNNTVPVEYLLFNKKKSDHWKKETLKKENRLGLNQNPSTF